MNELLHITAQYSNALLVAALPYVSDVATKLHLPIERPVITKQVTHVGIIPYRNHVMMGIWLTNGYWFGVNCSSGFVTSFRAPTNYFFEDEADVTKYAGKQNMTTNEAIDMVRSALIKLGYGPELSPLREAPELEGPANTLQGYIPYSRVKWQWPRGEDVLAPLVHYMTMDVDMNSKRIVGMDLYFGSTNMLPTKPIDAGFEPELEQEYQRKLQQNKPSEGKMYFDSNAPPKLVPSR
jgi:hypothetical protein